MSNRLLRYFYSKSLKNTNSIEMYNQVRNIVYKNLKECRNLVECFDKCKVELL